MADFIGWIAAALGAAYLVLAALIRRGTHRAWAGKRAIGPPLRVNVVIAARDEEKRLPATLESLKQQTYPAELWDVTVVDDRSSDGTAAIAREFARDWPRLRLVQVTECPSDLGGKQHALLLGIQPTDGDIILMTDADCQVPPTWVEDVAGTFDDEVGIVAGFATFPPSRSFWARLQQADLAHLIGTAWGFIGLGAPFSAIGNNLAVRRRVYEEISGYRSVGFSVAEDCALVQRVASMTSWRARMAPPSATVLTEPMPDLRSFFRQRIRWTSAVLSLRGWSLAFTIFIFAHRVLTLLATACASFDLLSWRWPLIAWSAWLVADALVVSRMSCALGIRTLAWLSPFVTLWQAIYHPVVGLSVLAGSGGVRWRGTTYRRRK